MGEWVVGALINIIGSIAINFGTNLLKLGHEQRERFSMVGGDGTKKPVMKSIIHFQSWRLGILFFALGNCLNFISFGYAAQSLLAALGSIQFVSNIAFSYFVLKKTVGIKRGVDLLSVSGTEYSAYWRMLLPFSYATVSGAVGSCSVLFAKSLSNLLRLSMSSNYQLNNWFMYSMLLLFLSTAGFWMTRLNEGLSLFDAILIVPMFQIVWTFFSICTGFVYFQEYQVFDALRVVMFLLGMACVFVGISLLAPDDSKGIESKVSMLQSSPAPGVAANINRAASLSSDETDMVANPFNSSILTKARSVLAKAKAACSMPFGLGDESISASSVIVMPMVSSRMTGFRESDFGRPKVFSFRSHDWSTLSIKDNNLDVDARETGALLPQNLG